MDERIEGAIAPEPLTGWHVDIADPRTHRWLRGPALSRADAYALAERIVAARDVCVCVRDDRGSVQASWSTPACRQSW